MVALAFVLLYSLALVICRSCDWLGRHYYWGVDWDVEELGALIESARRASCALEVRERCDRAERMLLLLKQRQTVVMY